MSLAPANTFTGTSEPTGHQQKHKGSHFYIRIQKKFVGHNDQVQKKIHMIYSPCFFEQSEAQIYRLL